MPLYCCEYVLRISFHQAHILLNNGVAELAIPNTMHFPQPAPYVRMLCSCSHIVVPQKSYNSSYNNKLY